MNPRLWSYRRRFQFTNNFHGSILQRCSMLGRIRRTFARSSLSREQELFHADNIVKCRIVVVADEGNSRSKRLLSGDYYLDWGVG